MSRILNKTRKTLKSIDFERSIKVMNVELKNEFRLEISSFLFKV
jgi:hypothetical protein